MRGAEQHSFQRRCFGVVVQMCSARVAEIHSGLVVQMCSTLVGEMYSVSFLRYVLGLLQRWVSTAAVPREVIVEKGGVWG